MDSPAGDGMGRRILGWGIPRAKLFGIRRLAVPPGKEVDFRENGRGSRQDLRCERQSRTGRHNDSDAIADLVADCR